MEEKVLNHKKSFNNKRYSHETTFSDYVWHLKGALDKTPDLKWSLMTCATPYSSISKKCLFGGVCMKNCLLLPIEDNRNS